MILFKEDWLKYPKAIADMQTTNRSFVKMAYVLKAMGIKNHMWPLALHNPELQGVDPFDPHLTLEQCVAIGIECKQNPWYYFREIAKAPKIAGGESIQVEANRANLSLWWCFFCHITYILIQPRQTGKSFCTDLLMVLLFGIYCTSTQINLLTKDDNLRTLNIKRLKDIYDELPIYLSYRTRDDANNTEELSVKALGNTYKTLVPNASPKRAYNVGRGITTPIFHSDEAPFQPNVGISMGAAMASMGAAIDRAKANGEPYGTILTTTAGKKDDKDGKYVYDYLQEAAIWSEHFYDSENEKELEKMVRRNSRKGKGERGVYRVYGNFNHTQLGKTDEWLRQKLEEANQSGDDANRDFFCLWTSGTESNPLPIHILNKLIASITQESFQEISSIGGYITRWYIEKDRVEEYMRTKKTIISVDTSDAGGGDDISLVITDVETGNLVAIGNFNETNLIVFAHWLISLLEKYLNSTMIIERRSSGATIIDYLLLFLPQRNIDPFKRLFNWIINDPHENRQLYDEACLPLRRRSEDLYVRAKKYFGWATSGTGQTSRSELYSTTLHNATKRCADRVKDKTLVDQMSGLVIRNGRVDHEKGAHDDLVIGWLLSFWLMMSGKNLQHYDIDSNSVLIKIVTEEVIKDPVQAYWHNEQILIRSKIQELYTQLSEESDQFICERIEAQLRVLDSKIILKDGEYYSLDSVINAAKEERKKKLKANRPAYSSYYSR